MATPSQTTNPTGLPPFLELRFTINGYGLFATEPIPRGTRLLCEDPFISAPSKSPSAIESIKQQLETFTPDRLSQYTELISGSSTFDKSERQELRERLAAKHPGIKTFAALRAKIDDAARLRAIYFNNSVDMGPGGRYDVGLFLHYSRINHSCTPNVQNTYNPALGKLTVHAIRYLAADEKLFTAYVDPMAPTLERRALMRLKWGFVCRCEACTSPGSQNRREAIRGIQQGLRAYETLTATLRTPENNTEALELSKKMTALLKDEGLVGGDLAKAYRVCARYAEIEGLLYLALAFARKALDVEKVCKGEDLN